MHSRTFEENDAAHKWTGISSEENFRARASIALTPQRSVYVREVLIPHFIVISRLFRRGRSYFEGAKTVHSRVRPGESGAYKRRAINPFCVVKYSRRFCTRVYKHACARAAQQSLRAVYARAQLSYSYPFVTHAQEPPVQCSMLNTAVHAHAPVIHAQVIAQLAPHTLFVASFHRFMTTRESL